MMGQVIWITGLSGSGKTTLAKELIYRLQENGVKPVLLDGDMLRRLFKISHGKVETYNREVRLGLAEKYGQTCEFLSSQGFTVVIATISMFEEIYAWNRENLPDYIEIYLKVPFEELRKRDPKSIYKRYEEGELINVAGLDLAVDEPSGSHLILDFEAQPLIWQTPNHLAEYVMSKLKKEIII